MQLEATMSDYQKNLHQMLSQSHVLLREALDVWSPYMEYMQQEVIPGMVTVWHRLDVPPWSVYQPALQAFGEDLWKLSQSGSQLAYLTGKPIAILCYLILQVLGEVGKVLFRILLEQGWIQLKAGWVQVRMGAIWFYRFQSQLTPTEWLGEAVIVGGLVGLYYLYRWIRLQSYWTRMMDEYYRQRGRAFEGASRFVQQVARVSILLAMAVPHVAFLGGYVALKVFFPATVKWFAHDTYSIALVSIWYPLIMTLSWIHEKKHPQAYTKSSVTTKADSKASVTTKADRRRKPSYMQSTASQEARESVSRSSRKSQPPSPFSKTHPGKAPSTPKRNPTSPRVGAQSPMAALFINEPEAATRYWLRYWVVYGLVQCLGTVVSMIPIFGSFVAKHPYVLYVCSELKLLFFIWIFCMEKVIGAAEDTFLKEAMPLNLLHKHVFPVLLDFECMVAESITRETWKSLVHSKATGALDVLTMLKLISDSRKEWILHFLEEGRTLVIPALCLFMPSFLTQYGVAYAQFVVPAAKSGRALDAKGNKEHIELLYLQYWVVHCLVSGVLSYFATLLWWIPFSTHGTFLLWCHLSFPKSIRQTYETLETELVAFGLLPGDSKIAVKDTRTAQMIQAVCSRLPSASESEIAALQEDGPTLESATSVDSQRSNAVEVSLRLKSSNRSSSSSIEKPKSVSSSKVDEEEEEEEEGSGDDSEEEEDDDDDDAEWVDTAASGDTKATLALTSSGSTMPESAALDSTEKENALSSSVRRSARQAKRKALERLLVD
eukprot:Nitzschia sp. Nitz4//scaffold139_size61406//8450//11155//NITZ4_006447-RA/size61406-snap-gene-0.8-mRNA-1//-1//CDS//3329535813//1131//frame0